MRKISQTLEVLLNMSGDVRYTTAELAHNRKITNIHANLKKLSEKGLIQVEKKGNTNFWQLTRTGIWLNYCLSSCPSLLKASSWKMIDAVIELSRGKVPKQKFRKAYGRIAKKLHAMDIITDRRYEDKVFVELKKTVKFENEKSQVNSDFKVFDLTHDIGSYMMQLSFQGNVEITEKEFMVDERGENSIRYCVINNLWTHMGTHVDLKGHLGNMAKDAEQLCDIPAEKFVGEALVADLSHKLRLVEKYVKDYYVDLKKVNMDELFKELEMTKEEIMNACSGLGLIRNSFVLLYTGFDRFWIGREQIAVKDKTSTIEGDKALAYLLHPYLSPEASEWLMKEGCRGVGMDTFSPEAVTIHHTSKSDTSKSKTNHNIILGSGGIIIENLKDLEKIKNQRVLLVAAPLKMEKCSNGFPARVLAIK